MSKKNKKGSNLKKVAIVASILQSLITAICMVYTTFFK